MKQRRILRKLWQGALIAVAVLAATTYFFAHSGPSLPPRLDSIVAEVLAKKLPRLITGETGVATSAGVKIWYESSVPESSGSGEPVKGVVLLVMGQGVSAIGGPTMLRRALLKAGYQVIRTDHRGLGMSDWVPNWSESNAYGLGDMAEDNIAVLDALNVKKAHLFGISMGGVISQKIAISHPDRVASVISMMSSSNAYDPELPPPPAEITRDIIKLFLRFGLIPSEEGAMKMMVGIYDLLKGREDTQVDIKEICESTLYELRNRRGLNNRGSDQHAAAVKKTGSLYGGLSKLTVPV